jgi:hypothetical protein
MNRPDSPVAIVLAASAVAMLWTGSLAAQERHGARADRPLAVAERAAADPAADDRPAHRPAPSRSSTPSATRDTATAVGARGVLNRQRELGLTADQARSLDAIARRYDDQDKLLRDDKARAASRVAERREVSAILREDQRAKAEKQ